MPVNRDVAQARIHPFIFLKDLHAHEVRHHVRQSEIVIALDPHDFDFALGIRELANRTQKFPVLFLEAPEVEVREDVAKKNQASEGVFFQHLGRGTRAAHLRAQMHVGEDQRVVDRRFHTLFIQNRCYRVMKCALKNVQR